MRLRPVLVGILFVVSRAPVNAAERQIQLFIAVSFNGDTTFALVEYAARRPSVFYGGRALLLGEIVGVEADFGDAPGFFQPGDPNLQPGGPVVLHSRVTTMTGNIIVAVPRRLTEYTLRPFFVGGAGLMRARAADFFGALPVSDTQPAIDIGAGVSGFITNQIGVSWDLRHFRTLGGGQTGGTNFGQQLSFWRAGMALAVRF